MKSTLSILARLWKKPLVRFGTSALILALLFTQLPLSDLWNTLTKVSLGTWLLAVLLFVTAHTVGVLKWNLLINIGSRKVPFSAAFRFYFLGLFSNLFLPSVAGGDVIRAGMAIRLSKDKEAVILGSLLDRFLDVCTLALFVAAGTLFTPGLLGPDGSLLLTWTAGILAVAALGGLVFLFLPLPQRTPERLVTVVERVRYCLKQLILTPQRALTAFVLSILIQGTFVLLNAYLGATVGIDIALAIWFMAWPLAKIAAMLPITLGGLGVREAALAGLLGRFGVSSAQAVGLGLLWQTILFAGGGLGGLFYMITGHSLPSRKNVMAVSSIEEDMAS